MPHPSRLLLLLGACAASCSAPGPAPLDGRAYPNQVQQEEVLDVQLFRDDRTVRLANTTTRPLGPGWLWLNAWYSAPIERIDIGETVVIPLRRFESEHGRPAPSGGFWAGGQPLSVVHAQIETVDSETGDRRFQGLVVVGGDRR